MAYKRVDDPSGAIGELQDAAQRILDESVARLGLKRSLKRDLVLKTFLNTREHLSVEELHALLKKKNRGIGYTTVYRTLKLLVQCGLASEVDFHDGIARYEHHLNRRNHHHMICTRCGQSIEFLAPEIDETERRVGEEFHFAPLRHSFQIYGICKSCQSKRG